MVKSLKDRLKFTEGKTEGLGVQASWVFIFQKNEKLSIRRKMTDLQIANWMVAEFPGHGSKFFIDLRKGDLNRVQQARTRFNRGDLTQHQAPDNKSHRYGGDGKCNDPIYSGKKGVSISRSKKASKTQKTVKNR